MFVCLGKETNVSDFSLEFVKLSVLETESGLEIECKLKFKNY